MVFFSFLFLVFLAFFSVGNLVPSPISCASVHLQKTGLIAVATGGSSPRHCWSIIAIAVCNTAWLSKPSHFNGSRLGPVRGKLACATTSTSSGTRTPAAINPATTGSTRFVVRNHSASGSSSLLRISRRTMCCAPRDHNGTGQIPMWSCRQATSFQQRKPGMPNSTNEFGSGLLTKATRLRPHAAK